MWTPFETVKILQSWSSNIEDDFKYWIGSSWWFENLKTKKFLELLKIIMKIIAKGLFFFHNL